MLELDSYKMGCFNQIIKNKSFQINSKQNLMNSTSLEIDIIIQKINIGKWEIFSLSANSNMYLTFNLESNNELFGRYRVFRQKK